MEGKYDPHKKPKLRTQHSTKQKPVLKRAAHSITVIMNKQRKVGLEQRKLGQIRLFSVYLSGMYLYFSIRGLILQ